MRLVATKLIFAASVVLPPRSPRHAGARHEPSVGILRAVLLWPARRQPTSRRRAFRLARAAFVLDMTDTTLVGVTGESMTGMSRVGAAAVARPSRSKNACPGAV